ncbi:hypothetical protein C8R43DRAFT_1143094 [Mycena crocata]|nr:hypothetical protein C8R43DRAFT_1143094 [Mycena crocata]
MTNHDDGAGYADCEVDAQVMLIKKLWGESWDSSGRKRSSATQGRRLPTRYAGFDAAGWTHSRTPTLDKENIDDAVGKGKGRSSDHERYPLVLFPGVDGGPSEAVLLLRGEVRSEDAHGKLARARTLKLVKVDLGKGQSYMALSRAQSIAGLQVLRFEAGKVSAHPKVSEWNRALEIVPV